MDKRLKRLTIPQKKAIAWLRKHPMECVVWATEQAKRRTVYTVSDDTDSDDENDAQNEGSLQQKEKEDLRALSLTDPPVEEAKSGEADASEDECSTASTEQSDTDGVNDSTPIDVLDELRATLRKSDPESLRYRQVEHMLQEQEQQRPSRKNFAEKQHQLRKTSLRERAVSTQTADLLPSDPDVVMSTPILMELQSHCDQQRAQEERDRRENARQAFEGAWLRNTEIELQECVEKLHFAQGSVLPQKHASISRGPLRQAQDAPQQLGNLEQTRGCAGAKEGMRDPWPVNYKCSGPASRDPRGRASP